jgi:protocatechuate 3,4-dioxygenase beta subunit
VPTGTLDLRVRIPGFVSHYVWGATVQKNKDLDLGSIVFEPGASLVGRVEAGRGQTLGETARVEIQPGGPPAYEPAKQQSRLSALVLSTPVDQRGFFHFKGIAPGPYRLQAKQSGGPPSQPLIVNVVADSEVTIERALVLESWADLEILITPALSPDGEPWRAELSDVDLQRSVSETIARTVCDGSGVARFPHITPGTYVVKAKAGDGSTWFAGRVEAIPGQSLANIQVDVVEVRGRLLLGERPLTGTVWFGGARGSVRIKVPTDSKGRFQAALPHAGKWPVDVVGEDIEVKRSFGSVEVGSSGQRRELELVIPDTCISGEVVKEDGSSAEQAVVTVMGDKGLEQTVQAPVHEGRFEVRGLEAGTVTVRAEQAAADSDWVTVFLKQGGDPVKVRLTLRKKTLLSGRVVASGRPVPGARLVAWSAASFGGLPDATTRTGVDGSFELRIPGRAAEEMLAVEAAGFSRRAMRVAVQAERPIDVPVSQVGGTLIVSFAEPPTYTDPMFSGYVVLHAGVVEDYFGLEIWGRRHDGDPEGADQFEIHALEEGEYTICRAAPSEYPVLAAGRTLADRCSSATVPPGGQARIRVK